MRPSVVSGKCFDWILHYVYNSQGKFGEFRLSWGQILSVQLIPFVRTWWCSRRASYQSQTSLICIFLDQLGKVPSVLAPCPILITWRNASPVWCGHGDCPTSNLIATACRKKGCLYAWYCAETATSFFQSLVKCLVASLRVRVFSRICYFLLIVYL